LGFERGELKLELRRRGDLKTRLDAVWHHRDRADHRAKAEHRAFADVELGDGSRHEVFLQGEGLAAARDEVDLTDRNGHDGFS